jgi:hypothetical protein
MPISMDSIFRPLNDFFTQQFAAGSGGAVKFRFARLPRVLVDSDFLDAMHPDWPPSPAIARELLSRMVDGVTHLEADGRTVSINPSTRISELYNDEILGPAVPFVPADVTDPTQKQALIDAFIQAKGTAVGLWGTIVAESFDGMSKFRPSTAQPPQWWDKNDPGIWTPKSFTVKGAATSPGQPPPTSDPVLRMKVSDTVLRSVMVAYMPVAAGAPALGIAAAPAAARAVSLSPQTMMVARPVFAAALANESFQETPVNRAATSVALHTDLNPKIRALPYTQRTEIETLLATNAQTKPVVTSDVTINFSYRLVNITREWYHSAFVNNSFWAIPGQAKGKLSANDGHGIPALPVGFVAIKGLSIQAPWTPEDVTNLELSEQFGPFCFDSKVVNGAVGHEGIQIIGWMLQDMPDLPPNQ